MIYSENHSRICLENFYERYTYFCIKNNQTVYRKSSTIF